MFTRFEVTAHIVVDSYDVHQMTRVILGLLNAHAVSLYFKVFYYPYRQNFGRRGTGVHLRIRLARTDCQSVPHFSFIRHKHYIELVHHLKRDLSDRC
jgi:hypothetical protein